MSDSKHSVTIHTALPTRLLTPAQTAEYLGIKLPTLYTMCSQRRIPYVKVGRLNKFDPKQLESWIAKHTVVPRKQT
ncbi:helix-turn-helix domain-containing protein [Nitrospira sp. Nam74]